MSFSTVYDTMKEICNDIDEQYKLTWWERNQYKVRILKIRLQSMIFIFETIVSSIPDKALTPIERKNIELIRDLNRKIVFDRK